MLALNFPSRNIEDVSPSKTSEVFERNERLGFTWPLNVHVVSVAIVLKSPLGGANLKWGRKGNRANWPCFGCQLSAM